MKSHVEKLNAVNFPDFQKEKLYQIPFYQGQPLPDAYSRWQATVDSMTQGLTIEEEMYLMVDQAHIIAGNTHRREGMHIDGHWDATLNCHGGGHRGGMIAGWTDSGGGQWNDKSARDDVWEFDGKGGLLLASDVVACRAMIGEFDGVIPPMGDCGHIDTSRMNEVVLDKNTTYFTNVTCLHESLPVNQDCFRTLVRITLPENYVQ